MLSFSKIITFAAVAFGTLSQAIPLSPRDASIEARNANEGLIKGVLTGTVDVVNLETVYLVPVNATLVNVSPILNNVYGIICNAVDAVDELADKPVEVVVGVVTVEDVEGLVCEILAIVAQALVIVLTLVKDTGILQILTLIVNVTFIFVQAIVKVTGGFGGVLLVYIQGYVAIGPVADVLSLLKIASP